MELGQGEMTVIYWQADRLIGSLDVENEERWSLEVIPNLLQVTVKG